MTCIDYVYVGNWQCSSDATPREQGNDTTAQPIFRMYSIKMDGWLVRHPHAPMIDGSVTPSKKLKHGFWWKASFLSRIFGIISRACLSSLWRDVANLMLFPTSLRHEFALKKVTPYQPADQSNPPKGGTSWGVIRALPLLCCCARAY